MKRLIALLALCTSSLVGQEIQRDIDHLQNLINSSEWAKAALLSASIKEEVAEARDKATAGGNVALVDSILDRMPPDTETLVVGQEPFVVAPTMPAAGYIAGLLAVAEKGDLLGQFANRTITLAAIGARKFGEGGPTDNVPRLGLIPYEGCAVYQFHEAPGEPLLARGPEEIVAEHPVWQSKGSENGGPDWETFYVTMLNPQLMAVCNNRDFLLQVLARTSTQSRPRALPTNLPEWILVDRGSPVWGISHYREGGIARAWLQVPEATGIAVNFGKTVTTGRMISTTDPWGQIADAPEFHTKAKTRKMSDGVWEITVPSPGEAGGMAELVLMAALGFAVLI